MRKPKALGLPSKAPSDLRAERDADGVPHLAADSSSSLLWGLGYCHAMDRGLQLLASRIFGQGRVGELLAANAETHEVDVFFRRLDWCTSAAAEVAKLSSEAAACLEAYTSGINARLERSSPWELRLMGYTPEPWTAADTILISRLTGYVGLAQSQGELERFLVELIQAGVDDARLTALFPNIPELRALDGSSPLLASRALLERVRLGQRMVPDGVRWLCPIPPMTASNGWVLAPRKTRSGHAMLANDPHLEVNRLPNVWYEVVAQLRSIPGHYVLAATMPGLPAPLLGRTPGLAWGATYSFMDGIDSWIEECQGGRYRRGDRFISFNQRKEEIKRKGKSSVHLTFYHNEHGVLDGDPCKDGYLLSTRWAAADSGARSLQAALAMWTAEDVERGMHELGSIETAWNWMLADRAGNIGYQMSGLMPKRRAGVSGFVPLPGWFPENDWQGFEAHADLPRAKNPACGYLVTANQDLNRFSKLTPQNATMADYRAERITRMLEQSNDLTIEASAAIQYDTYSLQAELFMAHLRPLLPDTSAGQLLRDWDLRYGVGSLGARLFERFYAALTELVIGHHVIGPEVTRHLLNATALFTTFFKNIDPILLDPPREFCAGRTRDDLYLEAFNQAAAADPGALDEPTLTLNHLLFAGRLPRWTGFDRGPIRLPGGRATPLQVQFYQVGSRAGCLAPSIRLIADLGEDVLHTNIAGGPSDRRFSPWYCSGLDAWTRGIFRRSQAGPLR